MSVEAAAAQDRPIPKEPLTPSEGPAAEAPSSISVTEPALAPAGELPLEPALAELDAELEAPAAPVIGVRLLEGGIIEVALPPNGEIEGPEAREAGAAVRALAAGKRMAVLLVISGVVGVSVEARQVYAGSIAALAFALVGESPVDRVIAHYLLRSRTETIPAEFFTSRTAALDWLGPYTREK